MPWVYDPHSGGVKIPPAVQERTRQRILAYACLLLTVHGRAARATTCHHRRDACATASSLA